MAIQVNTINQPLKSSKLYCSLALTLLVSFVNPLYAADRFSPPTLGAPLSNFDKRLNSQQLNVSFILARVLNEARLAHRAGDDIRKTTSIFRSESDSTRAISNSVIIPPGTRADTIIVINQNDGDSYAIHR